ncbi:amidase [Salipaludibacillus keqinensis]|uniref:Amidase n=1 Tax=Salipaludibacillus keqinensis TaxID=2045207 RepID=A0A323TIC0_9BACI|nr:amidase family protein [Salipaludibacillus keqinensis]PYZ94641.1 amidase [Salipaludibacillus keqinensis]
MLSPRLQLFHDTKLEELTLQQAREYMDRGLISAKDLVLLYMHRIATFDKGPNGLHSILEINPDALQTAEALDQERKETGYRSALHGVPVLVKDNLATADKMHTSAGSIALKDSYATKDSFVVKQLREAGAIILGKTNMTEWANFMSDEMPSGYSSRGGQVMNPYGSSFDCGGSSSGSGASVAANFAMLAIGTETSGSILSPASQNSLVGVKPTVGLISRSGIVPISTTQDTAGPMARTVVDAALTMNSLTAFDPLDPITNTNILRDTDFTSNLDTNGLEGAKVGIVREGIFKYMTDEQLPIVEQAIAQLRDMGAHIVDEVTIPSMQASWTMDVMTYEFKVALNAHLKDYHSISAPKMLAEIIEFNRRNPDERLKYGQSILEQSEQTSGTLTDAAYLNALTFDQYKAKEEGIDAVLQEHQLDALVFPNNFGASIPAKAGYPSVTVPAGYTSAGEPVGITFTGSAFSESTLLKYAYAFEQATKQRKKPQL